MRHLHPALLACYYNSMILHRHAVVIAMCLLMAACSDNAGAGLRSDAGGGSGADADGSGGGTSPNDAGMCGNREARAADAVQAALATADVSCSRNADCESISIDTDCHAACGAVVSASGKRKVQAVIAAQNAGTCSGFQADG